MTATTTDRPDMPVLLGLAELTALFPVNPQTVYRWRISRNSAPPVLPEPLLEVSGTPLWTEDTILQFAKDRGHKIDRNELRKIRRAQGRR